MNEAIILCAGLSSRMGFDKLQLKLNGNALWLSAVLAFSSREDFDRIIIVGRDISLFEPYIDFTDERFLFVKGGDTRTESVKNALKVSKGKLVVIHDGGRPFISQELITSVVKGGEKFFACTPVLPLKDSIKRIENGIIIGSIKRDNVCLVQTPQAFDGERIRKAYSEVSGTFTDDTEVYSVLYGEVATVVGDENNIKFTTPFDAAGLNKRVGLGGDIHRLKEELPLYLGGVLVPHYKGLEAHSDGDVILHAIMDGLLSAADEPDIGVWFPPSDDSFRGISSLVLLKRVRDILAKKCFFTDFISAVVFAEKPRLSGYIPLMRKKIGETLCIDESRVNISVTTTERLGEIGEEKAVACLAICTVSRNYV